MSWFKKVLANDAKNSAIRTVVLGMHAALPDSSSAGHSMNDSAQEQETGRKVYAQLSAFRKSTGKNVYVLASHSHFVMNNVYDTACHKDDVLDRLDHGQCRGGALSSARRTSTTQTLR